MLQDALRFETETHVTENAATLAQYTSVTPDYLPVWFDGLTNTQLNQLTALVDKMHRAVHIERQKAKRHGT